MAVQTMQKPIKHNNDETQTIPPWYTQFWPWFLIALPGCVVIACLFMVTLAFKKADQLIDDNYYKNGLAINQVKQDLDYAKAHQISAQLDLIKTEQSWQFIAHLTGDIARNPNYLLLNLEHPLEQGLDQEILLKPIHNDAQTYRGALNFNEAPTELKSAFKLEAKQFWYAQIQSANHLGKSEKLWRIKGKFNSSDQKALLLAK